MSGMNVNNRGFTVNGRGTQAGAASGVPNTVLSEDCLMWYRFEDGDARDYASDNEFPDENWADPTAYDGSISGAAWNSSGGVVDFENGTDSGMFDFDGSDDYITTGLNMPAQSWTIVIWGYPTSPGEEGSLVAGTSSGGYFELEHDSSDVWQFKDDNQSGPTGGLTFDTWQMVTAVWDDSDDTGYLYVNDSNTASDGMNAASMDSHEAVVGENSKFNQDFNGRVDEVRIYNKPLSGTEITDIYNNTKP